MLYPIKKLFPLITISLLPVMAQSAEICTDTLQVKIFDQAPLSWPIEKLNELKQTSIKTQRSNQISGQDAASVYETEWRGVLLKDLLNDSGVAKIDGRALRNTVVRVIATDGYAATYSWGELFNSRLGQETLMVSHMNGQPLDAQAGPLALRALGDIRPGPRHVRNACAVILSR